MATNNNNVWNDIQKGVKKLYVNNTTIKKQYQKDKILKKARQLMNTYKKFNMDIDRFNKFYNINNSEVEGIKYSYIMNIIVKEFDNRKQKKKEQEQNITNGVNKNNNSFNKYQNANKGKGMSSREMSKKYKEGIQENNREKYEIEKNENKEVYIEKLKKERLIEKYKGDLDRFVKISETPKYKKFDISLIEECVIEKFKKKNKILDSYYHDKDINYYYFLLKDFDKFKKCVEKGVIILTSDYIPQHLIDNSPEQKEYLNYSSSRNVTIIKGKLKNAKEKINIQGKISKKENNIQIKIYKNLRKVDPDHYRIQNEKEKERERDQIFNLFIKVSLTGYKFKEVPKIEDFFYDKNEEKYIYLNLNNLIPDETKNNFSNFKKKWNEFINHNNTKFLDFKNIDLDGKYEMNEKKFKEEKKKIKDVKFNSYDLIIPASLAAIVGGLLIGKSINNLTKKPNES